MKTKHIKNILVLLIVSILIEVFICNFNHFKTLNYKSTKFNNINILVSKENNKYIEINNINKKINNIKFNISIPENIEYIDYTIYATDEANSLYFKLPTRHYYKYIEKSKYIKFLEEADIIINATSVGMYPNDKSSILTEGEISKLPNNKEKGK